MKKLNPEKVMSQWLEKSLKVDCYERILDMASETNVSENQSFQSDFNEFYQVDKSEEWKKSYYDLFEEAKKNSYSFAEIIEALYQKTGDVEPSLASKMLATIDNDLPIWDGYVLENIGLQLPECEDEKELLQTAIVYYDVIRDWYCAYLGTENARECIRKFDAMIPDFDWLSDVKKIDYYLWGNCI